MSLGGERSNYSFLISSQWLKKKNTDKVDQVEEDCQLERGLRDLGSRHR